MVREGVDDLGDFYGCYGSGGGEEEVVFFVVEVGGGLEDCGAREVGIWGGRRVLS